MVEELEEPEEPQELEELKRNSRNHRNQLNCSESVLDIWNRNGCLEWVFVLGLHEESTKDPVVMSICGLSDTMQRLYRSIHRTHGLISGTASERA